MGLIIGLDIDGVTADSFPVFLTELNKFYGKNVAVINNYDMSELFDVAWDDMDKFFEENVESLFFDPRPMEGALETIQNWLQAGHEIIFITSRKKGREEKVTLEWFDRYEIPADKVIFTGGMSKTFAVQEFGIDIFVEDYLGNALEIAALGIPVLLLDSPYNQGKLPRGVIRCCKWKEIKCQVEKLETQKELEIEQKDNIAN